MLWMDSMQLTNNILGKLASNKKLKIGILLNASEHIYIKFAGQFSHIINNIYRFYGIKRGTKIQKKSSPFKYQSRFTTLKGTTMAIKEVLKCHVTTNCFHN